jgi:DNA-binding response OmpR family regulator
MSRILVVEDDVHVAASLEALLQHEGHHVTIARTIADAHRLLDSSIELVLLDWMLPDGQGVDALKVWRHKTDVPVIFVTARADVVDRVVGLEIGADDYVTKPFEGRELLARIKARLRGKATPSVAQKVEHLGVTIDLDTLETRFQGKVVELTRMELSLLRLLLEHPGKVFTRDELLHRVWGYERAPATRTVDAHVLSLRTKLAADLIESVRGIGYRSRKNETQS